MKAQCYLSSGTDFGSPDVTIIDIIERDPYILKAYISFENRYIQSDDTLDNWEIIELFKNGKKVLLTFDKVNLYKLTGYITEIPNVLFMFEKTYIGRRKKQELYHDRHPKHQQHSPQATK